MRERKWGSVGGTMSSLASSLLTLPMPYSSVMACAADAPSEHACRGHTSASDAPPGHAP